MTRAELQGMKLNRLRKILRGCGERGSHVNRLNKYEVIDRILRYTGGAEKKAEHPAMPETPVLKAGDKVAWDGRWTKADRPGQHGKAGQVVEVLRGIDSNNDYFVKCKDSSGATCKFYVRPYTLSPKPAPKPAQEIPRMERTATQQDLFDLLAQGLDGKVKAGLDEDSAKALVRAEVRRELAKSSRPVKVELPDGEVKDIGVVHRDFEPLLKIVSADVPLMIVGAAGGGKSHTCRKIADALSLRFEAQSVCPQTSKFDLMGYKDAHGQYVPTTLREVYENGGVYLLDEIDAGSPEVLVVLNAMTSDIASFPDGMVEKHKDFRFIATANTYGHGGDMEYVGRLPMDGATRDRFVVWTMEYDEELERQIAGDDTWTRKVQAARRAMQDSHERMIVSPRASIYGARLRAAGLDDETIAKTCLIKGAGHDIETRILDTIATA